MMTWEQAQGWLAEMSRYMQAKAAERETLQSGHAVEVAGPMISLDPVSRMEPAPYEPTWSLAVYGRVTGTGASGAPLDTGYDLALRIPRGTTLILPGSIWQSTNFFSLTGEEDEKPVSREITLELQSRGYEGGAVPAYEETVYYVPVIVTVAVLRNVYSEGGSLLEQVQESTEDFVLRRRGESKSFVAEKPDTIYELKPLEVKLI